MSHEQYKEICLAIKNDIDFEEFSILCSVRKYTEEYSQRVWKMYCEKPLEFVLYHDVGKDVFEYIRLKGEIIRRVYQP